MLNGVDDKMPFVMEAVQFFDRLNEDSAGKLIASHGHMEDFFTGGDKQVNFIFNDNVFQRVDKRVVFLARRRDNKIVL